ncbi:GtrA family protein, partial [Acinetobacter baumannii]
TFAKRGAGAQRDLTRYILVTALQLPLSLGFCSLAVEKFGLPYPVAVVLSSVLFIPSTYLLHRNWSFGLRSRASVTGCQ